MTRLARPGSHNAALGDYGERVAARHLEDAGLEVLDRNWRCDLGEIDLVLREGSLTVVCEVKTRSSTAFGFPLEAVTETKAGRLRRLAARWLVDHPAASREVRLDLMGVLLPRRGAPIIDHVRGVG